MSEIKVSVVIPIYNVEKYLKKCLESIEKQTLKDIEIILINDGSKDSSQEIIEEFVGISSHSVKCVIKENAGQAAARNQGLKLAKGEYVAFVDSDDYLEKDYLEVLYDAAIKYRSDLVCCGYRLVDDTGKIIKNVSVTGDKVTKYGKAGMFVVWGKLFERKFLLEKKIEFQEGGKIFEDVPYSISSKFMSNNPIAINYIGYNYVKRSGSTMNSGTVQSKRFPYEKMTEAIERSLQNICDTEGRERLEFEVLHFWAGFLLRYCRRAKKEDINELLKYSNKLIDNYFPQYAQNRYVRLKNENEQLFIERCAVRIFVLLKKIGLLNLFVQIFTRF